MPGARAGTRPGLAAGPSSACLARLSSQGLYNSGGVCLIVGSTEVILITGAAGRIGTLLRSRLARPGRVLRLLDILPCEALSPGEEVVRASVTSPRAMRKACRDVDAIVHLAGSAGESSWNEIVEVNIRGAYVVFEAARL
ncbi:MAG: NAD-dependent epimerase/dehydratase family protein, partial [Acidimicrobiales bacterium]